MSLADLEKFVQMKTYRYVYRKGFVQTQVLDGPIEPVSNQFGFVECTLYGYHWTVNELQYRELYLFYYTSEKAAKNAPRFISEHRVAKAYESVYKDHQENKPSKVKAFFDKLGL